MNRDEDDRLLSEAFASARIDVGDDDFVDTVVGELDGVRRSKVMRRIALGTLIALLAIPLQDVGLLTAHALMINLVELEAGLVAQLLAPINTVGGVLSAVLLCLRSAYLRIFRRSR